MPDATERASTGTAAFPELPFEDDFSTDKGWLNDTGGDYYRDPDNEWVSWHVSRSKDTKYYMPIERYSGDFRLEARLKATDWNGNVSLRFGLAEDLTGCFQDPDWPTGLFVDFNYYGGYSPPTSFRAHAEYADRDWYISPVHVPYSMNQWYRVVFTVIGLNWTIAVYDDAGNPVGDVSGVFPQGFGGFNYILLTSWDTGGEWPNGDGLFDDLVVEGLGASFSISGQVTDSDGGPVEGVTVTPSEGYPAVTDAGGVYTITGVTTGTYTITPSKPGYTFAPLTRTVTVPPDATGQDFVGHGVPLPPGEAIIFLADFDDTGNSDVWAIAPDGSNLTQLINTPDLNEVWAQLTPDGTSLLTVTRIEPDPRWFDHTYFLTDFTTGSTEELLADVDLKGVSVTFSPDGQQLMFYRNRQDIPYQDTDLWRADLDGGNLFRLTDTTGKTNENPHMSLDRIIAYNQGIQFQAGSGVIAMIDEYGNNYHTFPQVVPGCNHQEPRWSHDGLTVLFQVEGVGIYAMDADGGNVTQLAANAGYGRWSPDDTRIAVTRDGDLCIMDADGGNQQLVLSDAANLVVVDFGELVEGERPLFVDWEATGANDGSSWDDAFVDLQLALDVAQEGDDIWVAAGTYYPSVEHGGTGDRYQSFQMLNGVGIYGGFDPSVGDTGWEDRDWVANETILSGDIGTPGNLNDNCHHVFYHPTELALSDTAVLDGFSVSDGYASGGGEHDYGAGMLNDSASPTLANCTFASNHAGLYSGSGGGMYNLNSSPNLIGCTFRSNWAGWESGSGGGMQNDASSPTLTSCTFEGNLAATAGAGMTNSHGSSPTLVDCTFRNNDAWGGDSWSMFGIGGGMCNSYDSSPTLTGCVFEDNDAETYGGGMTNWQSSSPILRDCVFVGNGHLDFELVGGGMANLYDSSPTLANCSFSGNMAVACGGMYNDDASPTLTNCTFEGNTDFDWGYYGCGGMCNYDSSPTLTNCTFHGNVSYDEGAGAICSYGASLPMLANCILWGDLPYEIHDLPGSSTAVTFSDIQGGYEGEGNIDADPLWVDPENGDYHLSADSPCIDAGTNEAPFLPEYDYEGDPRILDGDGDGTAIVDMGIDEAPVPMHVGAIEGTFWLDYMGRPVLRIHVLVEDQVPEPVSDVLVEASLWAPDGGPYVRERYTKPTGYARFHWGSTASGTWTVCVEDLARNGYVYVPDDNVVTCMDWEY